MIEMEMMLGRRVVDGKETLGILNGETRFGRMLAMTKLKRTSSGEKVSDGELRWTRVLDIVAVIDELPVEYLKGGRLAWFQRLHMSSKYSTLKPPGRI